MRCWCLAALGLTTVTGVPVPADAAPVPVTSDEMFIDTGVAAQLLGAAEAALIAGHLDLALQKLQQIVALPENAATPRATELLGVVAQRRGAVDEARRTFENYLRRYPATEDSRRVEQRLANLAKPATPPATVTPASPDGWKTGVRGVASQFYFRDQSRSVYADPRRLGLGGAIDIRDNVDQLLSAIDMTLTVANPDVRLEGRVAALVTRDFRKTALVSGTRGVDNTRRLLDLYVDAQSTDNHWSGRLGRQQLLGAGVFGRFDGVSLGWQVSPAVRLHLIAGDPVITTRHVAVDTSRVFYGVSADYAWPGRTWLTSLYWFDQRASGLVDRQAIGGELRFTGHRLRGYAIVDVDVHFGQLSQALGALTYAVDKATTATLTIDSLHYPLLATSNAVIGQPVPYLDAVKDSFTPATLHQIALDRTSVTRSLTLTASRILSARWQVDVDAVLVGTSGLPASAGANAIDHTGLESYVGGQLIRTGLLTADDSAILGVHFAHTARFQVYSADLYARLAALPRLRLDGRVRLGYRVDRVGTGRLWSLQPSLRSIYRLTRSTDLDIEAGGTILRQRYGDTILTGPRHEESWLLNAGYRIAF